MSKVTLYHNPNCSKSRALLALLEENGIDACVIDYLDHPPSVTQLQQLLRQLGLPVRDILRRSEPEFEALGLDDVSLADEIVLDILARHPRLLQRPILVVGDQAVIGRPPERALQLLDLT